jgi:hypothetical protein
MSIQAIVMHTPRLTVMVALLAWLVSACNPTKRLDDGEYLLNKNIIDVDRNDVKEELLPVLRQKPNRRLLGILRFHLGVYTMFDHGKDSKFKNWMKNTIGEEPVILDTILTSRSTQQLQQYLINDGYFNNTVSDTTIYKRKKKKARVEYTVTTGKRYGIRNIDYTISDPVVRQLVLKDSSSFILKKGAPFNASGFQKERERIVNLLADAGYYDFNQQFISFNVDSALNSYQVDVELVISNPDPADSTLLHKQYMIDNIFIRTDYDPIEVESSVPIDTIQDLGYHFLKTDDGKPKFKHQAIVARFFIEENKKYSITDVKKTYRGLTSLENFRFVNIRFEPDSSAPEGHNGLNSFISLTPLPKQDYTVELEGTHNGGNFGVGANFSYRNKNVFRGMEQFEFRLRGVMETLPNFVDSTESRVRPFDFNTYEFGPELNIRIPRMLWPFRRNKSKLEDPVTLFSISYNYQLRPEFKKNSSILSTGLEYTESKYKKHFIYPAEFNYSQVDLTNAFRDKLLDTGDPLLLLYYRSYLITNGRYSFVFNNQDPKVRKNFSYLRFNVEIAGNSLRLADLITNSDYSNDSSYQVLNTNYAQYVRPEVEYRYYHNLTSNSQFVYRAYGGLGYAYLNSDFVPYEKVFYSGGANELRAFNARKVGPGSYRDTLNFEQFGDIKFNANVEYRFDLVRKLKGAFFLDAGNVWFRESIPNRPGGQFELENILPELALGTGIGIRFDFTFFIFRIDGGIPLRDPSRDEGDRWVIDGIKFNTVIYNFGIGYPF